MQPSGASTPPYHLAGPPPEDFHFKPKHKSNAYAAASEGAAAHADWGPETQG